MSDRFLNPYHFVPAKCSGSTNDLPVSNLQDHAGHVSHDRYHENTFSGRIICRLTTRTPVFIGDKEIEPASERPPKPKHVSPFKIDGDPAIPATSLRGIISGVAEAASNSALRILDDARYSYRKPFSNNEERLKPLSAIGMIVFTGGKPELRPLTLPTIEFQQGKPILLPQQWARFCKYPNLKVYFGDSKSIRRKDFRLETYRDDDKQYRYLKLPSVQWKNGHQGELDARLPGLDIKGGQQRKYLVSLKANPQELPRTEQEIPPGQRDSYTRGILRVLGCFEKGDEIPTGKKHEIFIPYPEGAESWPTFPIPDEVVARFHELAAQRTAEDKESSDPLPFHPRGTKRNLDPDNYGKDFRLKDGDLVYFRVENTPAGPRIAEIALSSIWRGRVEERLQGQLHWTTTHRFFESGNVDLVPFKAARKMVTVAEQMFGFVEEGKDASQGSSQALAGRIYFSHGLFAGLRRADNQAWEDTSVSPFESEATLRILGSPKPPSPALYFKYPNRGGYIRKWDLQAGKHHPQGRKFYLHHHPDDVAMKRWRTAPDKEKENCLQKVKITPVKAGSVFYFSVDFDNLSSHEMGLFLYSLRPAQSFQHKIGMGKPLGLGSVSIEPVGVFLVNRQKRYSASGLFDGTGQLAPRYHQVWLASGEDRVQWPSRYSTEKDAKGSGFDAEEISRAFAAEMDPDIKNALELLGDPSKIIVPVRTPLTEGNLDDESETFKWFVANDQEQRAKWGRDKIKPQESNLEPLTKDTKELPTLRVHPWVD